MKNSLRFLAILFSASFYRLEAQCSFTGLNSNYCVNSPTSALSGTLPAGVFSGPGITGSVFNPSVAGSGTHVITYSSSCNFYSVSVGSYNLLSAVGSTISQYGVSTISDDSNVGPYNIGFTFNFFCNNYTQFYLCSNGWITFSGAQGVTYPGVAIPNTATPNNLIAGCWADLWPNQGGTITYTTLGSSPNRTCVISYINVPYYNYQSTVVSFQIQLFETINRIEIHTTSIPVDPDGNTRTMGIENGGGTAGYPVTGRNATTTWTAATECQRFWPGSTCVTTQTTIVSPSTITVVGSNSICNGATTTLTATNNNTYTWSTTSGTISNSAQITPAPTSNTTYSVSGTNAFGCIANSAITVTVDNTPTVGIVSTATSGGICPGRTVALTGTGATSYNWTGGITNGQSFTLASTSGFTVTGANACGTATAATSVSIHPTPTIGAVVSQPTLCSGNTVIFTGTGGCSNCYTWTAQNGINPSNGSAYFPNNTQSYTVVGASALSCTSSAVTQVTVVTTPLQPPVATPTAICIGSSATISATGATGYTWSAVGGTFTANTSSIVVNPPTTTTYQVTKANANCVDVKTIALIVNPLPFLFTVANPTTVCAGKPSGLQVGGGNTYTWMSSPTTTIASGSSANNVTVYPTVTTDYTVKGFDGNCTNTAVVQVSVNPNPTISVAHTGTRICLLQCTTFTLSGADSYTWSTTPPGPAPNGNTIATICPTTSTNYSLSGTNQFSCTSAIQQVVVVDPLPNISTSISKPLVCSTFSSVLSATGSPGPVSYNWSTGSNLQTSTVYPVTESCYVVTVTINSTGCKDTRTLCVNVYQPTFAVTPDTAICRGGAISICIFGAQSNTWTTINPPSQFNCITVSPTVNTLYMVSAQQTSNNVQCTGTNSVMVTIYQQPTVTAIAERTTICRGDVVNLIGGGASQYLWSNSMSGDTISVSPNNMTTYTVWGTDIYGCKDTNQVTVRVSTCPGWNELHAGSGLRVWPNPNTGEFVISASESSRNSGMKLMLVNELGQVVRLIVLTGDNNHQVKVTDLAKGVYFLSGTNDSGEIREKIVVTK
jgi:hypothetical protein